MARVMLCRRRMKCSYLVTVCFSQQKQVSLTLMNEMRRLDFSKSG